MSGTNGARSQARAHGARCFIPRARRIKISRWTARGGLLFCLCFSLSFYSLVSFKRLNRVFPFESFWRKLCCETQVLLLAPGEVSLMLDPRANWGQGSSVAAAKWSRVWGACVVPTLGESSSRGKKAGEDGRHRPGLIHGVSSDRLLHFGDERARSF